MPDVLRKVHFMTRSPEETAAMARRLAPCLHEGDVILLTGEVGAGKTHFARSLIAASLVSPEDIPSPTFTLVQTYAGQNGEIWHVDLYRLTDISEIEELGLLQAFTEAICLVEWPDRLGTLAPEHALSIAFDAGEEPEARAVTLDWCAPRWDRAIEGWRHD